MKIGGRYNWKNQPECCADPDYLSDLAEAALKRLEGGE